MANVPAPCPGAEPSLIPLSPSCQSPRTPGFESQRFGGQAEKRTSRHVLEECAQTIAMVQVVVVKDGPPGDLHRMIRNSGRNVADRVSCNPGPPAQIQIFVVQEVLLVESAKSSIHVC